MIEENSFYKILASILQITFIPTDQRVLPA